MHLFFHLLAPVESLLKLLAHSFSNLFFSLQLLLGDLDYSVKVNLYARHEGQLLDYTFVLL